MKCCAAVFVLLFATSLTAMGCASGTGVNPRGGDGGVDAGRDTSAPPDDANAADGGSTLDMAVPDSALACVAGTTRPCSSSCATGTQTCIGGAWAACNAPTTCACTTGEPPRTIACMNCGTQQQTCQGGSWVNSGLCTGSGPCAPGDMGVGATCGMCGQQSRTCQNDCTWGAWACNGGGVCVAGTVEPGMQTCGSCGTGTQTRSRTCDATTCQWGAFTAWSACVGGGSGVCTPGQVDMATQACGNCGSGTQTRTRSCDVSMGCVWGAWSGWSACSGASGCTPGSTRGGCDTNSLGAATACGVNTCQSNCTWGAACDLAPGAACLSARGTDERCCTPAGGGVGWQFCSPTCQWNGCVAHAGC